MTTTLLQRPGARKCAILLALFIHLGLLAISQNFKGKDGSETLTATGNVVLNRYTALAATANSGALSITVTDIDQLKGSYALTNGINVFTNDALGAGDLIMIIQMQGADITTTDNLSYGAITNYQGAGDYELRTVYNVTGNIISLCQNLSKTFTQSGRSRTQVIRVPRLTSLNVASGVVITAQAWNGTVGGVVAIENSLDVVLNGKITTDAQGFRGGIDDKNSSSTSGVAGNSSYRILSLVLGGGKGESIAGNSTDYASLNGAYGRGAVANGGGGGNGHNTGGGGGSNAGVNNVLLPWNGTGLKSLATANWKAAWELESLNFSTDVSTGGGRGGYSYSSSNQDALTVAPGSTAWSGDYRQNYGGFGGRPLDYNNNTRLFAGGGGGSGDGNNSAAGVGGNGGGIVYLLTNGNISGTGSISANGQNGFNTESSNKDAAGGAGGGGSILANVHGTISGVSFSANGGNGGNQLNISNEAEGPGGGGGGGYIAATAAVSASVAGGENGISQSTHVTEFTPNGATKGNAGTVASISFTDVTSCDAAGYVLSVNITSFTAAALDKNAILKWSATNETAGTNYELQRSYDNNHFSTIAVIMGSSAVSGYSYTDRNVNNGKTVYYRLLITENTARGQYSDTRIVRFSNAANTIINLYPNPVKGTLHVELPVQLHHKDLQVRILDVAGQQVSAFQSNNTSGSEQIDVSRFANGIYILQITCDGQHIQQRFVKQ